jgi:hypothetical protein
MSKLTDLAEPNIRFLSLNKLQAFTLEREVFGASQKKHFKNDCYVGCVVLKDDNLEDIANFFIRQQLKVEECDLFISVCSHLDSNIVDVPNIVNRMLKFIDCRLTFSYTIIEDAI